MLNTQAGWLWFKKRVNGRCIGDHLGDHLGGGMGEAQGNRSMASKARRRSDVTVSFNRFSSCRSIAMTIEFRTWSPY